MQSPHTVSIDTTATHICAWKKITDTYEVWLYIGYNSYLDEYYMDVNLHYYSIPVDCVNANDVWWHHSQGSAYSCTSLSVSLSFDYDESEDGGCYGSGSSCSVSSS